MELLTAVNSILPFLEENTVTSTDTKHPTVALILSKIETAREFILTKGYSFNNETTRFYLTPEGKVEVGTHVLAMYPVDKRLNYELRGEYVYDMGKGTDNIAEPFDAQITVDLPFNKLPHFAALAVQWRAATEAYAQDFQVDQVVQMLDTREREATHLLDREHLRKRNFSSMRSAAGFRYLNSLRA